MTKDFVSTNIIKISIKLTLFYPLGTIKHALHFAIRIPHATSMCKLWNINENKVQNTVSKHDITLDSSIQLQTIKLCWIYVCICNTIFSHLYNVLRAHIRSTKKEQKIKNKREMYFSRYVFRVAKTLRNTFPLFIASIKSYQMLFGYFILLSIYATAPNYI